MLRGMMVFPVRKEGRQVLLMAFDDSVVILQGAVEGDGFVVAPGCVTRLSAWVHPEIRVLVDDSGCWNYKAVVQLCTPHIRQVRAK